MGDPAPTAAGCRAAVVIIVYGTAGGVDDEKTGNNYADEIINNERGKIVTAFRGARSAALREQLRIRSFTGVLVATILAMTVLAAVVAFMGYKNPTAVPLCFEPQETNGKSVVVCPTAHSGLLPTGPGSGAAFDVAIRRATRPGDLFLIEILGLTAAAAHVGHQRGHTE